MATVLSDLRHALRVLSSHKAFALAALSILTLSIGVNLAIFTLVSDTPLRPLPLPDSARVVRIEERHAGQRLNLTGATLSIFDSRRRSLPPSPHTQNSHLTILIVQEWSAETAAVAAVS